MKIQVGDQLRYTVNDYEYCLTVVEAHTKWVTVQHAPPHEDVRFVYYLYDQANVGAMTNLIAKIERDAYEYISITAAPSWEV